MRTPGPAAGAALTALLTDVIRPFRMVTDVAMVLAASMVWIRPLVSTSVCSAAISCAETTAAPGPVARAAAPAAAPTNCRREDPLSFIGRIIPLECGVAPISIRGLTKRYGNILAVNNLNLEVVQGEILGFLGLNGAGKTTTIRILLDLLRPNSGNAFILGHDCQADGLQARLNIGYLPGEMGIYSDLTGREVLDLLAGLSGHVVDKLRRGELQERLEFPTSDLRRRLREYSTGMKRKLGLIQAFQSDPMLLILDEPTEGLDPLMQESFYKLLVDVKRRGRTVFMSSHVLSEVDRVCDRIALVRKGELVLLSGVEELRKLAARPVRVFFAEDVPIAAGLPPGSEVIETAPRSWNLKVEGPLGPLLRAIAALPVQDIEIAEAKLEDVILKYYRDGGHDSAQ
jgi:ABC-2 type transport system ATP-binding protein